ncbi:glycosyltransferase [Neisseria sp.]|uniref:glycosyltransferase n=1 Tax=Neisseria sp. TaxID=192066 RepID=UPI0035A17ED4
MKIIISTFMGGLGGTENASYRLGRLLKSHGHDVVLASSDGPLIPDAQAAGIRWYGIDFYGSATGYLKAVLQFAKMLKKEKPDIVHCQMAKIVPGCVAAAKLASPRTKVFYHARGLMAPTYPKIAKLFDKLGVYIIANCRHERDKIIRHGFPEERITYTYNALHQADYVPEKTVKDYVQLGTLSRLDHIRAVHLTLEIFKMLVERGLNVRLNVAGIGEDMEDLKRQAQDLGIADRVTFLGGVRDLTAYFREVDILLSNPKCIGDDCAGLGNNILEAGIYKTPVVTYRMSGNGEIVINGETGFLTEFGEKERFADYVELLVHNPGKRRELGEALHKRVFTLCSDEEIYRTTMAAYAMADKT